MVNVVISLIRTGDTFSRFYQVLKNACFIGPNFQGSPQGDCLANQNQLTGTGAGPFILTINGDTPAPGDTYSVQVNTGTPWTGQITFDGVVVAKSLGVQNSYQLVYTVPSAADNKYQSPARIVGI